MNLEINKNLFAAWCGMIISGYDLFDSDEKEISYICGEIMDKMYEIVSQVMSFCFFKDKYS